MPTWKYVPENEKQRSVKMRNAGDYPVQNLNTMPETTCSPISKEFQDISECLCRLEELRIHLLDKVSQFMRPMEPVPCDESRTKMQSQPASDFEHQCSTVKNRILNVCDSIEAILNQSCL